VMERLEDLLLERGGIGRRPVAAAADLGGGIGVSSCLHSPIVGGAEVEPPPGLGAGNGELRRPVRRGFGAVRARPGPPEGRPGLLPCRRRKAAAPRAHARWRPPAGAPPAARTRRRPP